MGKQEIAAKLNEAADLIEKRGWWDGNTENASGECAVTAIQGPIRSVSLAALANYLGILPGGIAAWNDRNDAPTVIAALRGAARAQLKDGK